MMKPYDLLEHWYDKVLYRMGFVRRREYDQLFQAYNDVFGWWSKLTIESMSEQDKADAEAELRRSVQEGQ